MAFSQVNDHAFPVSDSRGPTSITQSSPEIPHVVGNHAQPEPHLVRPKWFVEFVRLCLFDYLEPQQVAHLMRGVEMVAIKQDPV
jgi:hypothetical protein